MTWKFALIYIIIIVCTLGAFSVYNMFEHQRKIEEIQVGYQLQNKYKMAEIELENKLEKEGK